MAAPILALGLGGVAALGREDAEIHVRLGAFGDGPLGGDVLGYRPSRAPSGARGSASRGSAGQHRGPL